MVTVYRSLVAAAAASLFFVPMTARAQYNAQVQVQVQPYQPQQPVYQAPPPPQDAVAGNGEYVTPMQQQTQQTYVPQSVAMSGPRVLKDWHEGDPIPPGYHPATRARTALIGGGVAMFGSSYLISVLVAAVGEDNKGCSQWDSTYTTCVRQGSNAAAPLFIPVVGPFITMGNTDSATADVFLVVDGLLQAVGLGMFIYGVSVPKVVLVRNDLGKVEFHPTPIVSKDMAGLGVVGTF
jgi:hypothetical protein